MLLPLLVREDEGRRSLLIIDYWLLINFSFNNEQHGQREFFFLSPDDDEPDEPDCLYFANG